ncbi:MAG: creatininase family protein [Bacteroidota bacterium]
MLFTELNYRIINSSIDKKVVVLPLGAIEQHGPHLAVSTDFACVTEVAMGAERKLRDKMLVCPTLPFGSSHHHLRFGGTISMSAETYTRVIIELVESLLQNGFRRIILLNGHGGNVVPVKQALSVLSHKYDKTMTPNIVLATYWELGGKVFAGEPPMETPALSHACEYETSLMLHLFPERVYKENIQRANRPEKNGYIPFEDDEPPSGVSMSKLTEFISSNGSSGEPGLGTKEKGKHLFDHAVNALVKFVQSYKDWPLLEDLSK